MKRVFFHITVSLVTFTVAVYVTGIFRLYFEPDVTLPEVVKIQREFSCFPGLSVRVVKSNDQTEFFPVLALWRNYSARGFVYSSYLDAMHERPLSACEDEDETYRFLWLRSFHHPVSIHVSRTGDHYFMNVTQLSGLVGHEPGTLDVNWGRAISEDDWDRFLMYLERSTFWTMPTRDGVLANDGAQWIMEGYREGRYHVVDRQSPGPDAYADACLYLLRQSSLLAETPANEVY